jgi:hypothetical protein
VAVFAPLLSVLPNQKQHPPVQLLSCCQHAGCWWAEAPAVLRVLPWPRLQLY